MFRFFYVLLFVVLFVFEIYFIVKKPQIIGTRGVLIMVIILTNSLILYVYRKGIKYAIFLLCLLLLICCTALYIFY